MSEGGEETKPAKPAKAGKLVDAEKLLKKHSEEEDIFLEKLEKRDPELAEDMGFANHESIGNTLRRKVGAGEARSVDNSFAKNKVLIKRKP